MARHIFISYRREDAQSAAGRLYDQLRRRFSADQLFLDVDAIPPGEDFVEVLQSKVAESDVMLVIIGPRWAEARDPSGAPRLENPNDFVRIEVEAALAGDARVIPVLVDGAELPRPTDVPPVLAPLLRRNAVTLSHQKFNLDADALAQALNPERKPEPRTSPPRPDRPALTPGARTGFSLTSRKTYLIAMGLLSVGAVPTFGYLAQGQTWAPVLTYFWLPASILVAALRLWGAKLNAALSALIMAPIALLQLFMLDLCARNGCGPLGTGLFSDFLRPEVLARLVAAAALAAAALALAPDRDGPNAAE